MEGIRLRRAVALVAAATLAATLAATALAAEVEAAKPKPRCQGKVATIVGTKKADILKGTAKRDIIVAKGGNDRIYAKGGNDLICAGTGNDLVVGGPGADVLWGQFGHDRLHGGPGPDFLAGQVGDDLLNGGLSLDTCYQGTGTGMVANCELPPPPPPPPPTLVVAYTDANLNHAYDAGDVMIAEIVDTNRDGVVGAGDTINMGQYPTRLDAVAPARIRQTMEPWVVKSHPVATADQDATVDIVYVQDSAGVYYSWARSSTTQDYDLYSEEDAYHESQLWDDRIAGDDDGVYTEAGSPSQPTGDLNIIAAGLGDDGFIDVEIYVP